MAIWQYKIYLFPNDGLQNCLGKVPPALSDELFEENEFWLGIDTSRIAWDEFEECLPKKKSWTESIVQYGNLEKSCVEVFHEESEVVEVSIRLDLRNLDKKLVEFVVSFAKRHHMTLFDSEGGRKIGSIDELAESLKNSNAVSFLNGPRSYIDNLSKNSS